MKIIELNVMQGPNYWSPEHHRLIVLTVDPGQPVKDPAHGLIEKPGENIPQHTPTSEKTGSVQLVNALKHIIISMLELAGMPCEYSASRASARGSHHYIIFSYTVEQAGIYAAKAALRFVNAVTEDAFYDPEADTNELKEIRLDYSLGPTTDYILGEVKRRGIPYRQFDHGSLITLGYGNKQKKIRTAVTDTTSGLGIELAGDKEETKKILAEARIPVPKGILVRSEEELKTRLQEVGFPLVLKPLDGNHGRGVTTDVNSFERAVFGFGIAKKISGTVIAEQYIKGDDYRFLVIDYKLVAVTKRRPAYITGDGKHTVKELIDLTNRDPERGEGTEHVLAPIYIDRVTEKILAERQLQLTSVLPDGKVLYLKDTANISSGGTAEDVTDSVHPENKFMVERIARIFKLDICGVDIMTGSVAEPVTAKTGAVIEVNAGPGLRMHSNPQQGRPRNVAAPIIDMLFRDTDNARIPVIAVTGTNGKTTTTRLIAYMAQLAGFTPGYTTTDGIYINGHLTFEGDCTGFYSTQDVLFDPSIDIAIVECARGGILKHGLGFERCDISITTNITEDHLGLKGIHTLGELIKVKSVVARSTSPDGYAILNADDEGVYNLHKELRCKMALFGMDIKNELIRSHIKSGGMAAVYEDEQIVIYSNGSRAILEDVKAIPLSFEGRAEFMIKNILAAVLAGTIQGFERDVIVKALRTFEPSPKMTPGRMNLYKFDGFKLMVDYVHNKDGFSQLKKFMDKTAASEKTGIIGVAGDRREEDIISIGRTAGQMFDNIIVRQDKHLRELSAGQINALLLTGIREVSAAVPVAFIADEKQAVEHAIRNASKDAFIFLCADIVAETIALVEQFHARHQQQINSL